MLIYWRVFAASNWILYILFCLAQKVDQKCVKRNTADVFFLNAGPAKRKPDFWEAQNISRQLSISKKK